MAIDADYHRTQITALYTQLAALNGKVDHSAMGRSFNYSNARKQIMDQIKWHEQQIEELSGPYEFETVVLP